jgi:hypothetical protein
MIRPPTDPARRPSSPVLVSQEKPLPYPIKDTVRSSFTGAQPVCPPAKKGLYGSKVRLSNPRAEERTTRAKWPSRPKWLDDGSRRVALDRIRSDPIRPEPRASL